MSNLEKEIYNHKTLQNSKKITDEDNKSCNCRSKANYSVNRECLNKGVICKATVVHKNEETVYIGLTGRQFKARFYEHPQSFRSAIKNVSKRLSRFIHRINNDNIDWKKLSNGRLLILEIKKDQEKYVLSAIWKDLKFHLQTTTNF